VEIKEYIIKKLAKSETGFLIKILLNFTYGKTSVTPKNPGLTNF